MKKLALALLLTGYCFAQTEPKEEEPKFYKLDFVLKELEGGKVQSTRSYISTVTLNSKASVRTGDKVPVSTGKAEGGFIYFDVGVNLDAQLFRADATKLMMHLSADISGFASPETNRVISSTRWNADVVVPLRKPTIVFTSDGAAGKHQTQLEITATPVQ